MAAYLPPLGILRDSDDERTFILGFAAGHITGYVAEMVGTFVIAVPTGIGLAVAGMVKVGRLGKAARALSILRKLRVAELRAAGETTTIAAGVLDWFHFLQKIPEGKLVSILSDPALNGKEEIILRAVMEYADDSEAIVDGERVVPGIVKLGEALGNADEPAETLLTLARLWEHPRLTSVGTASPGIAFSADASEFAVKGVDRLAKALREGKVSRGFLDRIISALDSGGADTALGKIHNTVDAFDGNLNRGLALEYFFKALSGPQWDGATFAQLERLAQRWATALPPPAADEAYFDIVVTIGKYGRNAEANTPGTAAAKTAAASEATARIVKQLDRITDDAGDVLKQLLLLDKTYSNGAAKAPLDFIARNMEAGKLGSDTSLVEELARFSKIDKDVDDAGGFNSTLFRLLKEQAGGEATTQLANKVKAVLANKAVAESLRPLGAVRTEVPTPDGKFIDSAVELVEPLTLTVRDVDASGNLVTRQMMIAAGTPVAFETKALATGSWDDAAIRTARTEIENGYRFVDPNGSGVGESLLAATPDILDDPAKLIALLQAIKDQPGYGPRSAVVILERPSMGADSFNNMARGIIRDPFR